MDFLSGKKSYCVALVMFLATLGVYVGQLPVDDGHPLSFWKAFIGACIAAAVATLRHAIAGNDSSAPSSPVGAGSGSSAVPLLAMMIALGVAFGSWGCAGTQARSRVDVPAIAHALPAALEDATGGAMALAREDQAAALEHIKAVETAVATSDADQILVAYQAHWEVAKTLALAWIDSQAKMGAIGPHGANLRRERVFLLGEDMARLAAPGGGGSVVVTPIGKR